MTTPPLDLVHLGDAAPDRRIPRRDRRRPRALRLRPHELRPALRDALAARGVELGDVRHLLLSHIHLDHAGAAGVLVRENPGSRCTSPRSVSPTSSTPRGSRRAPARLYGEAFDGLWGELAPVPVDNVRPVGDSVSASRLPDHGARVITCPICTRTGRSTRRRSGGADRARSFVYAPTPPPEVDLEAWERTLDELGRREARRLALIHFGVFDDVERHLAPYARRCTSGASGSPTGWTSRPSSRPREPMSLPRSRGGRGVRPRGAVLALLSRPRALLAQAGRRQRGASPRLVRSDSSEENSSASACVASRTTGGATPASSACCHRSAQRHHRSPFPDPQSPLRPRGRGVVPDRAAVLRGTRRSSRRTPHARRGPGPRPAVAVPPEAGHRVEPAASSGPPRTLSPSLTAEKSMGTRQISRFSRSGRSRGRSAEARRSAQRAIVASYALT